MRSRLPLTLAPDYMPPGTEHIGAAAAAFVTVVPFLPTGTLMVAYPVAIRGAP